MAKKDNLILWIIGIVVVVLVLYNYSPIREEGAIGLKVHYYKDGVEIFPQSVGIFTIVTGGKFTGEDYDEIAIDVIGTNNGEVPISNVRITAKSSEFGTSLDSATTKTLPVSNDPVTLWTSDLISVAQFEGTTISFTVFVSGDYSTYTTSDIGVAEIIFEGEVIPPVGDPELYESFYNANANVLGARESTWVGQSFTPGVGETFSISQVNARIYAYNPSSEICTFSIRATSGNKPTGVDLSTGSFDTSTLTTTPGDWYSVDMSPYTLQATQRYAIILACPDNIGQSLEIRWRGYSSGGYSGGDGMWSTNSGVDWAYDTRDADFEIWGIPV